jgi:predicted small metal-binding protein
MQLRCECGHAVQADCEQALVVAAQAHARDVHGMQLTGEQVLLALLREDLAGPSGPFGPPGPGTT